MKLKIYQVDAFAEKVFTGNPAAVCPLDKWLSDELLQNIAMENNLSETAFYVKQDNQYHIRWFTPTTEVDLCGHATLAAAFVIFNFEKPPKNTLEFYSDKSGKLMVSKNGDFFAMNFPSDEPKEIGFSEKFSSCFSIEPSKVLKGKTDLLFLYNNEEEIKNLIPNLQRISVLDCRCVIVSAKSEKEDFVSRVFAPQSGINEDPVTGSAHTTLIPFWANQLNKTELTAVQLSERKGILLCKDLGDRVEISGKANLYLEGEIYVD